MFVLFALMQKEPKKSRLFENGQNLLHCLNKDSRDERIGGWDNTNAMHLGHRRDMVPDAYFSAVPREAPALRSMRSS